MTIIYYTHCCLTETSTVMNCGTVAGVATNSLLLPMTTNETLFTDNYTKRPTNTPSPFRLCITNIVQFNTIEFSLILLSILNKRICYVMLCYVML